MRVCCCQDGVLAEHRTAVTASFSGGGSSDWDATSDDTASEPTEQPPVDGSASSSRDAADPAAAAEPQGIAQQSGGATAPGRRAPDAGQPAQSAGAAAAEEEQAQDIGPFEPEAIVSALSADDSNPQAQVTLLYQDSSTSCPHIFSERCP